MMEKITSNYFIIFLLTLLGSCFFTSCKQASEKNTAITTTVQEYPMDSLIDARIKVADSLRRAHRQYEEAIGELEQLLVHEQIPQASEASKSNIFHKLGVNYFLNNKYETAILYFDTAVTLRTDNPGVKKGDLANSIFLRGRSKTNLNYHEPALDDFLKTNELAITYPTEFDSTRYKTKLVQYYSFTGNSYSRLGDIGQADKYYEKTLAQIKEAYTGENRVTAAIYSSIGAHDMFNKEDTLNGFAMSRKAIDIYSQLGRERYYNNILDARNNIAGTYLKLGQIQKARNTFLNILNQINEFGSANAEKETVEEQKRLFYSNLGYTERELGNFEAAEGYYNQALDLALKNDPPNYQVNSSIAYEGLGDAARGRNQYTLALNNYQQAIHHLCIDYDNDSIFAQLPLANALIIDRSALKRILALKAETFTDHYIQNKDRNYLEEANRTYHSLDVLIGQIRKSYQGEDAKYDVVKDNIPIYEKATKVALQLFEQTREQGYLQDAFNFSSKNKAIVLLEDQQNQNAIYSKISPELLEQEQALRQAVFNLELEIFQLEQEIPRNELVLDSITTEYFNTSQTHDNLLARFERDYPTYYESKYALSHTFDLQAFSQLLPQNAALIEYFVGTDSLLYTYTISKKGLSYYTAAMPADFEDLCQDFRNISAHDTLKITANKDTLEEPVTLIEYYPIARRLYSLLLETPLKDLDHQNIDRLFIIPDNYLFELSFDAMLYDTLSKEQLDAGWGSPDLPPYLIRKYAISYAYSNRLLFQTNEEGQNAKKLFAGFAVDYKEEGIANMVQNNRAGNPIGTYPPLEHAVDEVQQVGNYLSGDTWLNEQATKANFFDVAADYKILHLAMHGNVDKDFPLNSALIFQGQQNALDPLTAADLYAHPLNADMAVLSACNTGDGLLQIGEGVMTLARAFNFAGCPSLAASLWTADDEPTKELMIDFYKYLKAGEPKDIAMQKAKIDYLVRNEYASLTSPHHWTHIAIIGDTSPLFEQSYFAYLAIGSGLFAFLFLLWRRRKRKETV